MDLVDQIYKDAQSAAKDRDETKLRTLRLLLAELHNKTKEKFGSKEGRLSDQEVVEVVQSQAKKTTEAREAFEAAGRDERALQEAAELAVLASYLPEQLSRQELEALVEQSVRASGARGLQDMGSVIKNVMEKAEGRADGKAVSDLVRNRLSHA